MKYYFFVLLIAGVCSPALAQNKNNLFCDIGFIGVRGSSVTYDRKLARHFEAGIGLNGYDRVYGVANVKSAAYIDLRPYWAMKRSLVFTYADIGIALHKGREKAMFTVDPFGFYSGLGVGYGYMINKRGMGPYISIGLNGYAMHQRSMDVTLPAAARDYSVFDASSVISIGFKF